MFLQLVLCRDGKFFVIFQHLEILSLVNLGADYFKANDYSVFLTDEFAEY